MTQRPKASSYEPNPWLRRLYEAAFRDIQVDNTWAEQVRALAEKGRVVYVLRSLNLVDFLALDHLTRQHGLPRIRFVNDLGLGMLNPIRPGWAEAFASWRGQKPAQKLIEALAHEGSAALFLKRPPSVLDIAAGSSGERGLTEGDDLLHTLLEVQRRDERSIYLVPQVFVWARGPDTAGVNVWNALFGSRQWPSTTRTAAQLLVNRGHVTLGLGEPLDLKDYLAQNQDYSDPAHVRRVTYAVLRRLERERQAVVGPRAKAPDRVRTEIVRSPRLRHTIAELAGERASERASLTAKALQMLEQLQATPDVSTMQALEVMLNRVFNRLYAGIEYDKRDIERVRQMARKGALILLPSHKSHVDYLILSYIFNKENLPVPFVAAGDNLNFFPAGPILRRAGGFFIRRAFRGDRLYAAVVDAYVRRLIRDGYPIELFLEGGRSRTGKLLPPKFGLLNMIVDAALGVPDQHTCFIPVSIGYERIIEADSFERELSGGEKRKEDAAGLLRSSNILRHRYGRINLQIGQLMPLGELREELALQTEAALTPAKRRALVTRLGNRVMDEINRVTAVTPGALTALALLGQGKRGITHAELVSLCSVLLVELKAQGARVTNATELPDGSLRPGAIFEAIQMFAETESVHIHAPEEPRRAFFRPKASRKTAAHNTVYTATEAKRLVLDTSKNIIVHFFVERGLVSLAILASPEREAPIDVVRERVQALSRLFKFEFRFRADAPFNAIFDETVEAMVARGTLQQSQARLKGGPGRGGFTGDQWLDIYASVLKNFLEGYLLAAHTLKSLLTAPLTDKELEKLALSAGQRLYQEGTLSRREAISTPLIKNAIAAFAEHRYITQVDGKWLLTETFQSEAAVSSVEASIAQFLPAEASA
ncbi:MAG: 1-acyl-sn-glycerol-3-phosphate acyltransferase [Polyangiaceae bacterium]|nr:1-acyl-sn-glycerol-3-phosphate acyltransferase [Polyangiaceae bacterium]